jgi:hypothetical protein
MQMPNAFKGLKQVSKMEDYVAGLSHREKSALMIAIVSDYARISMKTDHPERWRRNLLDLVNNWFEVPVG